MGTGTSFAVVVTCLQAIDPHSFLVAAALLVADAPNVSSQMRPQDMHTRPIRLLESFGGPGGMVSLTVPMQFCVDDKYFLLLRRHTLEGIHSLVQTPAGPSSCSWSVADLHPGRYDALILFRRTGEIAATARGEVLEGLTTPMMLEPLRTEVRGTVTVAGLPFDGGVQIKFVDEVMRWEWKAAVDAEGNYRVNLNSEPGNRVCAVVERREAMNGIRECTTFHAGTQSLDIDLLPGIVRINVLPNTSFGADRWGSVNVNGWGRGFKLAEGVQGEYFGGGYQAYRVRVTTGEGQPLTDEVTVSVTPENPAASVEFFRPRREP